MAPQGMIISEQCQQLALGDWVWRRKALRLTDNLFFFLKKNLFHFKNFKLFYCGNIKNKKILF